MITLFRRTHSRRRTRTGWHRPTDGAALSCCTHCPDGWVTDVPGITRSAALKALGNGVVPHQAALALELLDGA